MAVQREYLSPNEIAELLGVSPFTIRRYIKLGELKAVKLLGGFRIHRDDLHRFLKAREVNSDQEQLSPEKTTAEQAAPEPQAPKDPGPVRSQPVPRRVSPRTTPISRAKKPVPGSKKPRRPVE